MTELLDWIEDHDSYEVEHHEDGGALGETIIFRYEDAPKTSQIIDSNKTRLEFKGKPVASSKSGHQKVKQEFLESQGMENWDEVNEFAVVKSGEVHNGSMVPVLEISSDDPDSIKFILKLLAAPAETVRDVVDDTEKKNVGPRARDYCVLCNPGGYGREGMDGTEAIGVYYLPHEDSDGPSGWMPVCEECAISVSQHYEVEPISGHEDHPFFQGDRENELPDDMCNHVEHEWFKESLVTEDDMTDLVQCEECGVYAKRYGVGNKIEILGKEKPTDI